MNKNLIIVFIVFILAVLGLSLIFVCDNSSNSGNETTFNVSSEGPINLEDLINDIKTDEYFKGYDNETVEWMESLGPKYVFFSADEFVIMDIADADEIPSVYACDVDFYEIFSCNVIEKHSLGSGENFKDVYYVKNVKYIGEDAFYYDV